MNKYPVYSSLEEACSYLGVEPLDVPRDGRPHPVPLSDGSSKNAGRIAFFTNNGGGWVQNWKLGSDKALFFPDAKKSLNPAEIEARRASIERAQKEAYERTRKLYSAAKKTAAAVYAAAKNATGGNPYLLKKRVKPAGVLKTMDREQLIKALKYDPFGGEASAEGEILIIPRGNKKEGVTTLEFIDAEGNKRYLRHGQLRGAYWITDRLEPPGNSDMVIGICEGIATALSIRALASKVRAVVSVGGCTNFSPCIEELITRYPIAQIVILSDAGNGEKYAKEAARKYSLNIVIPQFSEIHKKRFRELTGKDKNPTDFNDLALIQSNEAQP